MSDRVAIYIRVSTEEQAKPDKPSLAQQQERCVAYCQAQEWEVIEVYEDAGVSGSLDPKLRPALGRLLEDAAAKKFHRLVFLKVDRLARNTRKVLNLSYRLDKLGVGLVSVVEQFDTGTAGGRFYFHLMGAVAEFESDTINERMSAGRKGAVKRGKYLASTTPYGYTRVNGALKVNRQQARWVRSMFKWASEGLGLRAIAQRLEAKHVQPPSSRNKQSQWGWHITTIYKLLTSPRYIGKATYGKESKEPMLCPTLVDEETFSVVQMALKKRKRDSPRNTKRFYLLQHLVYCRHCQGRYMAKSTWNQQGPRAVYVCRRRTVYGKNAGHEGIRWRWDGEQLETAIKKHLLRVLADREYLVHDARVYREEADQRYAEQRDQKEQLQTQLVKLERQELGILENLEKGVYRDDQQAQERLAAVRAQQGEVRVKLEALPTDAPEELTKAEKVRLIANQVIYGLAYPLGRGFARRILDGQTKEGWVEEALAYLGQQTHVEVEMSDEAQYTGVEFGSIEEAQAARERATVRERIPVDQWWRDVVTTLVDRIWVEDDRRTLTVEGVIRVASGKVQVDDSAFPRTR